MKWTLSLIHISPIPGTVFEVYHARTGNLVDTIRTDKNGVAVSKPFPLGRYKIVESQAADFYALDKTPIEVEIEHEGQICLLYTSAPGDSSDPNTPADQTDSTGQEAQAGEKNSVLPVVAVVAAVLLGGGAFYFIKRRR